MKKKYIILSLIIATIVGSLFTALASNMLFDDLFNKAVDFSNMTLFASLPAVSVALLFVLAIFYILRCYKHPKSVKRISRLYLILVCVFAVIGIVGDIMAGVSVYHTFVGAHPFPGYLIIFMILNILMLLGAVAGLVMLRKMKEDEEKIKINFLYVLKTIGWFLFVCMMFNRFGMFLGSPYFIYWRNFYQTFPVYLYLLVPLFLGVLEAAYILKIFPAKKMLIMTFVGIGVNVVIFLYTILMGMNDTAFVSSLSQLMPIERMASLPIEIIIHFLSYLGVGAALIVQNRNKKAEQ